MNPPDIKTRKSLGSLVGDVGIELGVQCGWFSRVLLMNSHCPTFYSIDRWAGDRGHDNTEYMKTLYALREFGERSLVLKMSFCEALPLFEDDSVSFIYIDGYAHQGQCKGETIYSWWPKIAAGGCFGGHDYSEEHFPLTYKYVNEFVAAHDLELHVIKEKPYPSWFVLKRERLV